MGNPRKGTEVSNMVAGKKKFGPVQMKVFENGREVGKDVSVQQQRSGTKKSRTPRCLIDSLEATKFLQIPRRGWPREAMKSEILWHYK